MLPYLAILWGVVGNFRRNVQLSLLLFYGVATKLHNLRELSNIVTPLALNNILTVLGALSLWS